MKKIIWILVILAVIAAAAIGVGKMKKGDKVTEITMEKVERGDITSIVVSTGKIHPEIEVKISSEVAGEIIELPVRDGQYVEKGDLLFVVNPDRLEAQVLQQEAALKTSHANSAGSKAQMMQRELDIKRLQELFKKGFATQEQIDTGETQFEIATANYKATLFRIEQQEMSLKEAKDSLAKATTFAPMSGTIIRLAAELGDRVVGTGQFEGTEILRIANLDQIEVRVDVSEADIVAISTGDSATIEIDALPDVEFEAIVTEIANSAKKAAQNAQDQMTSFQVKAKLANPTADIRPGMSATAEIKTKTVTDVIKVPIQSVTVRSRVEVNKQLGKDKGDPKDKAEEGKNDKKKKKNDNLQRVVFKFIDDKVTLVPVETGISDNRFIEIKSGVEADESVVTGSYRVLTRELKHDMAVKIAEKNNNNKKKK